MISEMRNIIVVTFCVFLLLISMCGVGAGSEEWEGSFSTSVVWEEVESWSSSVVVFEWDEVESWSSVVDSPNYEWKETELWRSTIANTVRWGLVESWGEPSSSYYLSSWQEIESWYSCIRTKSGWIEEESISVKVKGESGGTDKSLGLYIATSIAIGGGAALGVLMYYMKVV